MWTTWWLLPDCGATASRHCTSQHKTSCTMGQNRALKRSSPCSLWVSHLVFEERIILLLTPPHTHTHTRLVHICSNASFRWVTFTTNRWHISEEFTLLSVFVKNVGSFVNGRHRTSQNKVNTRLDIPDAWCSFRIQGGEKYQCHTFVGGSDSGTLAL